MEMKTVYFEEAEKDYTDEVLKIVREWAKELGIKTVVVASTTGKTAVKAVNALDGLNVVVVGTTTGAIDLNVQRFTPENRKIVESKGCTIVHTAHAFAGIGRAINQAFNTIEVTEIVAHTIRIFGQGIKVACEVALMATDAGLVSTGEQVIALGGTAPVRGADCAIVVRAANTHRFFDLKVKKILCNRDPEAIKK